ncbi:efflux transporter outer membrane subunit [Hyphococcus sp.]|uniref:efflux transporter outer membrane subunit n=1 Tax=Hyphococcus sp. TaxID=2038636 RepID=UPI003D0A73A9
MTFYTADLKRILTAAMAAMLCGCTSLTMAPGYDRPASPVAESFPEVEETEDVVRIADWRSVIADPVLVGLIETALQNNRDLRVAMLNVDRARALYRIQRADSLPTIAAEGGYLRQRVGENAAIGVPGAAGGGRTEPIILEQYSAEAGLSAYELDLFGRVRSLNRQALETYFATEDARRSAEISLIAEVSTAYLQLLADRERLAIARDTVESQQSSLSLTRELVANGIGNDLDVQRADTSVLRARADAAALEAQIARDENALRLLVGTAQLPDLNETAIENVALNEDFADVASDILLMRPDVSSAERRLMAANANIGAARAAFFPRILLTASAGTTSTELSNLFSGGTGVWSFAPSVSLPIFTGGRNLAQLKGAKIDRDIAVSEYERAVQAAFRDVADALATRRTIGERLEATEGLAAASERTFELADARFRNGIDDYFSVLDAQRADYATRQELVLVKLEEAVNVINLYRAFGGFPVVE